MTPTALLHEIRISKRFADFLTHNGVPELGYFEDYSKRFVDWMLTLEELRAVEDDAFQISNNTNYTKANREVARKARIVLADEIDKIEARYNLK